MSNVYLYQSQRNLTEYFNAAGIHNMLVVFASMLHERRIIITSKRISNLSACVQGGAQTF